MSHKHFNIKERKSLKVKLKKEVGFLKKMIEERSKKAEDRSVIGHFESDTIEEVEKRRNHDLCL